ncbi:hypothetical protein COBT_001121 [Conglomerata obtusa]
MFRSVYNKLLEGKITENNMTKKIPHYKIDRSLIMQIDAMCSEYMFNSVIENMTDVARIIQTAQNAYATLTTKPKQTKTHVTNKKNKIEQYTNILNKLLYYKENKKAENQSVLKQLRKYMKQNSLILDINKELIEAIVITMEKIRITVKQIDQYHKRC